MAGLTRLLALCSLVYFPLCFLFTGVFASPSSPSTTDRSSVLSPLDTLKLLFKRRRGGRGGSSGGSSDGDEDESEDDQEDEGGECRATTPLCFLGTGYNKYYRNGPGSRTGNTGGYSPDGSGEPPKWDNKTGAFVHIRIWENPGNGGLYFGGASVPFKPGEVSPTGIEPSGALSIGVDYVKDEKNEVCDFASVGSVGGQEYQIYRYTRDFNWTMPAENPLNATEKRSADNSSASYSQVFSTYCACKSDRVCGCDGNHANESFVDALVSKVWGLTHEYWPEGPRNKTDGCNMTIDGAPSLLIDGTLMTGSTKRDSSMERTEDTEEDLWSAACPGTCQYQAGANSILGVRGAYGTGWAMIMIVLAVVVNTP